MKSVEWLVLLSTEWYDHSHEHHGTFPGDPKLYQMDIKTEYEAL
jgi:hypothetical protein